jgi:hypothetical protein
MLDALKPLFDSGLLNEETRSAIGEAWTTQLDEAKETLRTEIREEFARRYEHDKEQMVEALDKMVSETLTAEIGKVKSEQQALKEDRVKLAQKVTTIGSKFQDFMVVKLAEEIKEFRKDRKVFGESAKKVENFIFKALAEELAEFAQDKRDLTEAKVKLIAEGKSQIGKLQKQFVARSSKMVKEAITTQLRAELKQLQDDISAARKNSFGRKIFEAFATEFSATHLNENAELRKLYKVISKKDSQLAEAQQKIAEKAALVETKDQALKNIQNRNVRNKILGELLSPLNKEKQGVMKQLLENVQTDRLKSAFDKYLPAVLNESAKPTVKKAITESKEVTGNKTARPADANDRNNIVDIRRLAGI